MQKLFSLIFLSAGLLFYCSKPVPVQELSDARSEIAKAEANGAEKYSADDQKAAREKLVAAHTALGEEKYDDAKASASEAFALARTANLASAPKAAYAEYQSARASLEAADKAWAEELARADYQKARELNSKAIQSYKDAKSKSEGLPALSEKPTAEEKAARADQEAEALNGFAKARDDFTAARTQADTAKNKALAQKSDMLNSLATIEKNLTKAEQYGAAQLAAAELSQGKKSVASARSMIGQGNLKDAHKEITMAEKMAGQALDKALPAYAAKKKEEAAAAVVAAEASYKGLGAGALKNKSAAASMEESLAAAHEALSGAEKNLQSKKYEDSVRDSEEALRLAAIVNEQALALGRNSVSEGPTPAGGKVYEISKKNPPECLSCISGKKEVYGDPYLWVKIYNANKEKIDNPHMVFPGQKLVIPEIEKEERARLRKEARQKQLEFLRKRGPATPAAGPAKAPAPAGKKPGAEMESQPRENIQ